MSADSTTGTTSSDSRSPKLINTSVIVKDFLKSHGLEKLHLDSYNNFINVRMPEILRANRRVTSDADSSWYLEYDGIRVGQPQVEDGLGPVKATSPNECRLRNLTYSAPILVDIRYILQGKEERKENVLIGKIPVMLRSQLCVLYGKSEEELMKLKECPLDPGGYFIAKGSEKAVLMQEQMMNDRIVCEFNPKKELTCFVISFSQDHKTRTTVVKKKGCYYVRFNMFREDIPVLMIFAAMGIHYLDMALGWIGREHFVLEKFTLSVDEFLCLDISKKEEALQYLAAKLKTGIVSWGLKRPKTAEVMQILVGTLISHVPVINGCFDDKAAFLSYMVRRCILAEKDPRLLDDRDHFGVKRLQLAGNILAFVFEDVIKTLNTEIKKRADHHLKTRARVSPYDPTTSIRADLVSKGFNYFLDTGNLNIRRFKINRVGVAQVLVRLSYVSAVGMMSRLQSQFEKSRKVSGPRSIQASQYGIVCPSDTPEGEGCGLTKNLALLCDLTVESPEDQIRKLLSCVATRTPQELAASPWTYPKGDVYTIFVNGSIFGFTKNHFHVHKSVKQARRLGKIDKFISAAVSDLHRTVTFATDGGRMCRPYFIVEGGRLLMQQKYVDAVRDGYLNFDDLVKEGAVEYLDVNELNDSLIALDESEISEQTTHMEIAPFSILGVVAGTIPFPHHNQSPRNTYQCAMGKQAIGAIALNQTSRIDTVLQCSWNPQRPLVQSKSYGITSFDQLPAGQNAIVAMVSYSAYDIEDAIILNKASLERGYQRCTVYRKHQTLLRALDTEKESLFPPRVNQSTGEIFPSDKKLDKDGLIVIGETVERGDVMINKYVPVGAAQPTDLSVNPLGGPNRSIARDKPEPVRFQEPNKCHIDKIMISQSEREQLIKVRTSQTRIPEIGDKFSSRHGQKGVCGLIVPEEDMPFTMSGIRPDAIMNPHGIPSRMTVGLLRELMGSKAGAIVGKIFDGSAFGEDRLEEMCQIMEKAGFDRSGKEILTDGVTGKMLEAYIFIGPFFYQRLKHMVIDKIHARSKGPRQSLTRQPTEGRARDGGLRMGEMERDCMIAHGVSALLNERLMLASDECEVLICDTCGLFVWKETCTSCRQSGKISAVRMPYACKLLFQELISMNIAPRMKVSSVNG
ncbi:LOW QUALITY PROTEIN: DNA-directed RNA polymerase III subunit RPC2-like [Paramacrobiotus metropolitanus]|uniref:LOW QUALITY PROTEIN: DNA-directed RNA polymerase III subunit RPC2-like n=1 Tax=Paramacrobiotus metropolitanus TaxID=2943436 RepID=UPI0024462FF6|nr:LOW QUALITY PROTEIN: DNA-directed RNA polymerase III subunit RPC2-like [Paramacrobiotus metropolitanus]